MEVDQLQSNKFLNMFTVGALTIVGERLLMGNAVHLKKLFSYWT